MNQFTNFIKQNEIIRLELVNSTTKKYKFSFSFFIWKLLQIFSFISMLFIGLKFLTLSILSFVKPGGPIETMLRDLPALYEPFYETFIYHVSIFNAFSVEENFLGVVVAFIIFSLLTELTNYGKKREAFLKILTPIYYNILVKALYIPIFKQVFGNKSNINVSNNHQHFNVHYNIEGKSVFIDFLPKSIKIEIKDNLLKTASSDKKVGLNNSFLNEIKDYPLVIDTNINIGRFTTTIDLTLCDTFTPKNIRRSLTGSNVENDYYLTNRTILIEKTNKMINDYISNYY
jgi:hypothetical protein